MKTDGGNIENSSTAVVKPMLQCARDETQGMGHKEWDFMEMSTGLVSSHMYDEVQGQMFFSLDLINKPTHFFFFIYIFCRGTVDELIITILAMLSL